MIISVLVEISNINIDKTFDYLVPSRLRDKIKIGLRVKVPFNNQNLEGFVLKIREGNDDDLKEIIDVVDEDVILNDELLLLGKFISKKYYSTLISAYQTMLPKALKAKNNTKINKSFDKYISLNIDINELDKIKLNDKQQKIIDILKKDKLVKKELLSIISISSLKTLLNKNIIKEIEKEKYRLNYEYSNINNKFNLTDEQENAKKVILSNKEFPKTFLIHGVTGSGKTVVYLEIIEEMLKNGKDSIFLVPEISLTPQMVEQLKNRFGDEVAILHSGLSEGEKYDEYRKIKEGKVHIAVGARSCVFAPFKNLGVIIIDEEHTTTYKQDNNPKYDTIDVAIERSKYHNSIVILGSATPNLITYAKANKGLYQLIELKERVNKSLPDIELVDLNKEKASIFSKKLIEEINIRLEKNEQVILLLNRRGYSSFISCSNCGYVEKCPNCDITLTYHKTSNVLRCHYCGYATKKQDICPSCKEKSMKNLGTGTEKVEEEIKKLFNCRVVRMDIDTTSRKGSHEKIIKDFKEHKYDILLGTQMIGKGLDFPNVTLVGIINADTSLMIPNYRSSEYTYQLLSQTAGRSGRGNKKGCVIIQTFNMDHYAIKYAKENDYIGFYKHEMSIRRELEYPPYYYLVYIKVIGKDYDELSKESNKISKILNDTLKNSIVLGPTTCSVFKLKNLYRFGIIIKYKKEDKLDEVLTNLLEHYKSNRKINIDIDINPNTI